MLKDIIEERQALAYQYMRNGYAGGQEGLRCTTCDNKFAGDSAMIKLCPRCFTAETAQIVAREVLRKAIEKVKKLETSDSYHFGAGFLAARDLAIEDLQSLEESLLKEEDVNLFIRE
jgi:hypothetical protein